MIGLLDAVKNHPSSILGNNYAMICRGFDAGRLVIRRLLIGSVARRQVAENGDRSATATELDWTGQRDGGGGVSLAHTVQQPRLFDRTKVQSERLL